MTPARSMLVVLVLLAAAAAAPAAARDPVVDEPGLSVAAAVDWAAGTVEVQVARQLSASTPSLVRAKADAEGEIRARLPELLARSVAPILLDSGRTIDDALGADPVLFGAVGDLLRDARPVDRALAADFGSLVERYVLPLFGPKGFARPFLPSRATPVRRFLGDVTTRAWTGLVIDARGDLPLKGTTGTVRLQPSLFPRIWDESMNPVLDVGACDPEAAARWGMAGWARGPDDDGVVLRAGVLPLRLAARAVFGEKGTDPVISVEGARQLLSLRENIRVLQEGRVVILYTPAR